VVYTKWESKAVGNETTKDKFSVGFSDIVTPLSRTITETWTDYRKGFRF